MDISLVEIEATNFLSWKKLHYRFPSKGVVFIAGDNGAGKSGFLEAIKVGMTSRPLSTASPVEATWRREWGSPPAK